MQQFLEGILSVLGCAANCVEKTEMLVNLRFAVLLGHRPAQPPLHFFCFAAQHGGLVCDADRLQMNVRVESLGTGALEFLEEFRLAAPVEYVVTNVIRLGQSEHDQVMTASVGHSL